MENFFITLFFIKNEVTALPIIHIIYVVRATDCLNMNIVIIINTKQLTWLTPLTPQRKTSIPSYNMFLFLHFLFFFWSICLWPVKLTV